MGYLKGDLSAEDKQELLSLIEDYRQGLLPLIVPLTLLKHHLNRCPVPERVHQQVFLDPYPKELMLRMPGRNPYVRIHSPRRIRCQRYGRRCVHLS